MFNDKKSMDVFDAAVYFDGIQSADIIDFSSYEVPDSLIEKIEKNLSKCSWLNYDHFNHNVLNYYIECNILDNDPCQKEYSMIEGIDLSTFKKTNKIKLTDEQERRIIADIYHYDLNKNARNSLIPSVGFPGEAASQKILSISSGFKSI